MIALTRGRAEVARLAHNQQVDGSSPSPATSFARVRSLAENGVVATPRESRRFTAPRSLVSALLLHLARPARERGKNHPAGRAGAGAAPIRNYFADVSEHEPAILYSIRRGVLAKGRDAAADRTHDTALRLSARSVAGSVLQMRKRHLISAQIVAEARAWADELTKKEIRGPFDLDEAWRRLETRYGIPYATFWSLRYRKDIKDVWGSIHTMLRLAVEAERNGAANNQSHRQAVNELIAGSSG